MRDIDSDIAARRHDRVAASDDASLKALRRDAALADDWDLVKAVQAVLDARSQS